MPPSKKKSSQLPKRIIITGCPGTGKSTLAKKLAMELRVQRISINDFATSEKLCYREPGSREKTADVKRLPGRLRARLKNLPGYIAEGHLACEFNIPADTVLVLRADPRILAGRYAKRGYSQGKADENLLAEFLDYCLVLAEKNYPETRIVQIDATKPSSVGAVKRKLADGSFDAVNWMGLLSSKRFSHLLRV